MHGRGKPLPYSWCVASTLVYAINWNLIIHPRWAKIKFVPLVRLAKKEMTLDCGCSSRAVKGHFSSLLLSNIIGYLTFLQIRCFPFFFETYLASLFLLSHSFLFSEKLFCVEVFPGKGVTVFWAQPLQMVSFCRFVTYYLNLLLVLKLTCFRHLSPEDTSNGLLTMLFAYLVTRPELSFALLARFLHDHWTHLFVSIQYHGNFTFSRWYFVQSA